MNELDNILEYFEEFNSGGGCTAEVAQIFIDDISYDVIVTDLSGSESPSYERGMLIGLYKEFDYCNGESAEEWFEYEPENIEQGITKLKELLKEIIK